MKDPRRSSKWVANVQARIEELDKSKDAHQVWVAHQLELSLRAYTTALDLANVHLDKLDVAAQEGSKVPPKKDLSWSEGYYKYHHLTNYVKEIVRTAERKFFLRLDEGSPDQLYFDVIAALASDARPAQCKHFSKVPGRNFAYALENLCRAELMSVPSKPNLSFYLEYVEQKLGLYRHEHIVFRKKPVGSKPKARKTK